MSDALKNLLAGKDRMPLCELAERWGREIEADPVDLRNAMIEAAAAGAFDHLPSGLGLLQVEGGKPYTMLGSSLVDASISNGRSPLELIGLFIEGERLAARGMNEFPFLALRRDAVLAFADSNDLRPPSWWRRSTSPNNKPNASPSALLTYLLSIADGEKTIDQLRDLALKHFANNKIPDRAIREALKKLPSNKKRARGQRVSSSRANAAP